jgi:hypothetical protein
MCIVFASSSQTWLNSIGASRSHWIYTSKYLVYRVYILYTVHSRAVLWIVYPPPSEPQKGLLALPLPGRSVLVYVNIVHTQPPVILVESNIPPHSCAKSRGSRIFCGRDAKLPRPPGSPDLVIDHSVILAMNTLGMYRSTIDRHDYCRQRGFYNTMAIITERHI